MVKRLLSVLTLLSLFSIFLYIRFNSVEVKAPSDYPVHNLDTSFNYTTIQEAVDANETLDGHTIFVEKGTYYENVVVNKTLWLIGENNSATIIDGKGIDNVLTITADNVNITGFSIQNSSSTWPNNFGLYLSSTRDCTIENCIIKNNGYSFYLQYAYNNTVRNNNITNNCYSVYLLFAHNNTVRNNIITNSSSYSVYIDAGDNNIVINNTITNNKSTGVGIESGSEGNIIADNNISSNCYEGVYVLHSDLNLIVNNMLSFNGHGNPPLVYPGIKLMYSSNNTLARNIILNNTGGIMVYFDWCSMPARYNTIEDNVVENNDYGIILYYGGNESHPSTTTYNQVFENTLKNNSYGLYLIGADNNTFYHNNLDGSTIAQVVVENSTNTWDNGLEGNYWSNYTGVDLNYDGIGDSSHVIDANNQDNYPLMGEFHKYQITHIDPGFTLTLISNSTISNFDVGVWIEHPENRIIIFNVAGETGYGFCRLCISKDLMAPPYIVTIDNGQTPVLHYNETLFDNSTHRWIYFAYLHSEHQVTIVPEFTSFLVLPLFMLATLLAVLIYGRKHSM